MPSIDERIESLNGQLQEAVKKHNQALEVVNTEKEKAFGLQKQLELLNEMKAEENPEEATVTEVV
jgi:hypothetical protein